MDAVIVPSEYLKRMVMGWGVEEQKIQVIYNALPRVHPHPLPPSPLHGEGESPADTINRVPTQFEARQQLGLRKDEPLLLTAARLTQWKGIDHLISALAHVPDVHLLVAGDGDRLPVYQVQAADMGVADRVTFLGKLNRETLDSYMQAADYVVLYSGYEGLSHTLLESLRAGTPVIASDKGGNPEVVQHGVNGLLVPYVNVEALAAALREAFSPGKRTHLAANSQIGMERFDFQRMVQQTSDVLRRYL
jgi:glycosyltransferase involved in cell wall biosynthesis